MFNRELNLRLNRKLNLINNDSSPFSSVHNAVKSPRLAYKENATNRCANNAVNAAENTRDWIITVTTAAVAQAPAIPNTTQSEPSETIPFVDL